MMLKKGFTVFLAVCLSVLLVSCRGEIELDLSTTSLTLIEGETFQIDVSTNDDQGVTYASSNSQVLTVSKTGLIEAISEGEAVVSVQSKTDTDITVDMTVTVRRDVTLTSDVSLLTMVVEETVLLDYVSNAGVTFSSSNDAVASVDQDGLVHAHSAGEIVITLQSTYDENVTLAVSVHVFDPADYIEIQGETIVNVGSPVTLTAAVSPDSAHQAVLWESDDPSLAHVSETGVITAYGKGTVTITAKSLHDETVFGAKTLQLIHHVLVAPQDTELEEMVFEAIRHMRDVNLFNTLEAALSATTSGATIQLLASTYEEALVLDTPDITLVGETDTLVTGFIEVKAEHITLNQMQFADEARIHVHKTAHHFTFTDNMASSFIGESSAILHIEAAHGIHISNNHFTHPAHDAIHIGAVTGGINRIENNIFNDVQDALFVAFGEDYTHDTIFIIERNEIEHVRTGLEILMDNDVNLPAILAYARFNSIASATHKLAVANLNTPFDLTLNHWGASTPNLDDFSNIDANQLRGFYATKAAIPSAASLNPDLPVKLLILNAVEDIMIGESHALDYEVLPLELETDRIRWITSNPEVLAINQEGTITPLRSGTATITVRSALSFAINHAVTITVSTTPGVALTPSNVMNDLLVGDSFTLHAEAFPVSVSDETIVFESSDPSIATIDATGYVETHQPGTVVLNARFASDDSVYETFTITVFESLDSNNLLDLLTMTQRTYTTPREWTAYGVGFDYNTKRYDSVSNYYFGEIPITEMIIPVFNAIRPGAPMEPHPPGITPFNPYNVYWVVIHDTANTNPGAGALAHANYLYNNSVNQTALWTSWHYTIDDVDIYRHMPEIERGFHAGDGSSLPGSSTQFLGGGNRNGIGIEMAINQDSDMYRTWQRTAKLAADIMVRYNLPREHLTYHQDFASKVCPRTLITAGLLPLFESFVDIEYTIRMDFPDAIITMTSHDPEYLDHAGRVIKMPQHSRTVSYTITVEVGGSIEQRTFYTYLPGTDR